MKKIILALLVLFGCASVQTDVVQVSYKGKTIKEFKVYKEYNDAMFFASTYQDMLDCETSGRVDIATKRPEQVQESFYKLPIKIEWTNRAGNIVKVITFEMMINSNELVPRDPSNKDKKLNVNLLLQGKL